jgi:hypothetical protein
MKMKNILWTISFLFFVVKNGNSQINLRLEANDRYFVGEIWRLSLSVSNFSDSTVRILAPQLLPYGCIEIELQDTLGNFFVPYRMNNLYVLSNRAHLNPNESPWRFKIYPSIISIASGQSYSSQFILDFSLLDTTKVGLARPIISEYLLLSYDELVEYKNLIFQEKTLILGKNKKISTLPKGQYKISVFYKYPLDKDWFCMFFDETYFKYLTECNIKSNKLDITVR